MCGEGARCQGGGGKTRPPGWGDSVCARLGRSGRQTSSPSRGEHARDWTCGEASRELQGGLAGWARRRLEAGRSP